MRRQLALALGLPTLLVLVQQQLLLRQPPRLQGLASAPASSGPAALQALFSRPMQTSSLERNSRLDPPLRSRWLGRGNALMLSLREGQRLRVPVPAAQDCGRGERGRGRTGSRAPP